jgi:hypothetical protein
VEASPSPLLSSEEKKRREEMRRNLMGNQSRKERIAHEKDSREKKRRTRGDALFLFPSALLVA